MVEIDWTKIYDPYKYLDTAHVDFHRSPARYKLIGGAMGGAKTVGGCAEGIQLSLDVPFNRGAILRKNRTVLKRTTLVTFFQICPSGIIQRYDKSDLEVTLSNGSVILFIEADEAKDPLFEKLKSLELGWYFIDEASEVSRAAHQTLGSRLRWKVARGRYHGILASNPEQCWLRDDFPVDATSKPKPGHRYFPFLPSANPFLPEEYIENLRQIYDEDQQRKYIDGDWSISDNPMQCVPYTALKNKIATKEEWESARGESSLGVDVAEFGNDKAVIAYMRGAIGTATEKFEHLRTDQFADIVQGRIAVQNINANKVGIDVVGIGAGVWGDLKKAGLNTQRIVAGESPIDTPESRKFFNNLKFANLKAQMWWKLRLEILDPESDIRIPNIQTLIQDLTAVRYSVRTEKTIVLEDKEVLKKRIGRSPDEGDAFVIANWVRTFSRSGSFKVLFSS